MGRRIKLRTRATTYGSGPFHPAIANGREVLYWPNVTFDNKYDAKIWAGAALEDAADEAEEHADKWNIWPVEG